MKILWLSHNVPYPPIGGVLQRNYNLIKEVASRHEVHLVAFNQKALLPTTAQLEEARKALAQFCARVDVLPISSDSCKLNWYSLVVTSLFTKDPCTINWLKSSIMHDKIRRIVQEGEFDLVHYDTISLAEYFDDTGDLPKVLNHHNVESAMMMRRSRKDPNIARAFYFYVEAKKLRAYERKSCPMFDANFVVSDLEKDVMAGQKRGGRIEVVPNGVDTDHYRPGAGSSAIKNGLLFSGRLDSYSNRAGILFFLGKVWPLLRAEIPDVHLTVLGKNPTRDLLRVAQRDANVAVTGFVRDARPYFEAAEAYVCPIWDGGGTRLKLLDAMAMGKAVVSTSIGCEGIEVTPGENILIANTPTEFVFQIKRVLENVNLRISLGKEARRLVTEKYSWKMIGANLCRIYETLAARPYRTVSPAGALGGVPAEGF